MRYIKRGHLDTAVKDSKGVDQNLGPIEQVNHLLRTIFNIDYMQSLIGNRLQPGTMRTMDHMPMHVVGRQGNEARLRPQASLRHARFAKCQMGFCTTSNIIAEPGSKNKVNLTFIC